MQPALFQVGSCVRTCSFAPFRSASCLRYGGLTLFFSDLFGAGGSALDVMFDLWTIPLLSISGAMTVIDWTENGRNASNESSANMIDR